MIEWEQGALSRLDACSLRRSGSLIPACATELLLFNAFAVPVVNLGSHSSELARSRCRAIPVRAFPSGWDWSAKRCCAPRRRVWRDICAAGSIKPGFAQRFRRLRPPALFVPYAKKSGQRPALFQGRRIRSGLLDLATLFHAHFLRHRHEALALAGIVALARLPRATARATMPARARVSWRCRRKCAWKRVARSRSPDRILRP